jgi:pimeloyl-ACP methyl ester carboxylesterase
VSQPRFPIAHIRYYNRRLQRRFRLWYRRSRGHAGVAMSLDMGSDSRALLVTFGGMRSLVGIPSFEFVRLTGEIPVKRLFVRDPRQSWYHRGLRKHGRTLASVADAVGDLIARHEVERVVMVGNSAGGYGALVFGTLLGADEVFAFAPQTVLDPGLLAEMNDHRWDDMLAPLIKKGALEPRWADLGVALPEARHTDTRYNVFFDERIRGDRLHAERLRHVEGVRLYKFGRGGHALVRALRDCGALERMLRAALGAPERAAVSDAEPELEFRRFS